MVRFFQLAFRRTALTIRAVCFVVTLPFRKPDLNMLPDLMLTLGEAYYKGHVEGTYRKFWNLLETLRSRIQQSIVSFLLFLPDEFIGPGENRLRLVTLAEC